MNLMALVTNRLDHLLGNFSGLVDDLVDGFRTSVQGRLDLIDGVLRGRGLIDEVDLSLLARDMLLDDSLMNNDGSASTMDVNNLGGLPLNPHIDRSKVAINDMLNSIKLLVVGFFFIIIFVEKFVITALSIKLLGFLTKHRHS